MLPNKKLLLFAILFLIFVPTTDAQVENLAYQVIAVSVNLTGPDEDIVAIHEALMFEDVGEMKHFHFEECINDEQILIYDLKFTHQTDGIMEVSGETVTLLAPDCRAEEIGTVTQIEPYPLLADRDDSFHTLLGDLTLDVAVANITYLCATDVDTDCDMIPNTDEQQLIDDYKPLMIFSPDEPLPLNEVAQVYQVSPTAITADGPQGALLTVVTLYSQDLGVQAVSLDEGIDHLTCNAAIMPAETLLGLPPVPVEGFTTLYNMLGFDLGAHCGDSEAMRVEFARSDGAWTPVTFHIKRHYDDWEEFPFHAPPYEYVEGTHVQLYISSAKHAAYPSLEACANYGHDLYSFGDGDVTCTFTFESCGNGLQHSFDIPFELNVGERHHPAFDALSETTCVPALFGAETAWTDQAFCGGCDAPKAGLLSETCGGALARKWAPVQRDERPDFYVPTSQIQSPLIEIFMDQPLGEVGWAEGEVVPYAGLTPLAPGHGVLQVINIGGSPFDFYYHGECDGPTPAFPGLGTAIYDHYLPAGHYDMCNIQGKLGEATVYEGQHTTVTLDTGELSVRDIGNAYYAVFPLGYFEAGKPPIANGASEQRYYGLKTGIYEIYTGQGYVGRATIYRGLQTTITLATGHLIVNNFGLGYYEVYQTGHRVEKLPFAGSAGSATYSFGLRNATYDIYWGPYRVGTATVYFGQRSVVTLNMGTVRVLDPNGRGYGLYEIGGEYPIGTGSLADRTYALRGFVYVLRVPDQPPHYFVVRQEEAIELTIN